MHSSSLIEIVTLLAFAITVLVIFRRLNLSPVLGYILVGILIGNDGFKIIKNVAATQHVAEYGVVFLLFAIGLELTFERLKEMRLHVFGFGSMQVLLCAAIIGEIINLMIGNSTAAFVVGAILALSSTAVVLQVLNERGEQATQTGRLALAALILQDIAFVPLIIVIPLLAQGNSDILLSIGEALLRAVAALFAIVVVGKKFLEPLYRLIATEKSEELFIATTLFILLGSAWFTQYYGLSLAFGAFIAGLLVAETEYRTQVDVDLKPFKGLLMGLFFISVGMTLDLITLKQNWVLIITLTATIIAAKTFVIYYLARAFGFGRSSSIKTGMLLAQSSEFGFVLLALAFDQGLIAGELEQILVITTAISMAVTPLLASLASRIARRIDLKNPVHYETGDIAREVSDLSNHVIVVGFDQIGKTTCDLLKYKEIPYVIIDEDPRSVHYGRRNGYPIFFGNIANAKALEDLGLKRCRLVAITLGKKEETTRLTNSLKSDYPSIHIIARATDRYHDRELKKLGVDISIAENFESSIMIGSFVLSSLGLSDGDVVNAIERFREKEYPDSQIQGMSYKIKSNVKPV